MALSIIPCADGITRSTDNRNTIISVNHHDHKQSDHNKDQCTPFCTCACCGSLFFMLHITKLTPLKIDLSSLFELHYSFDYTFDYNIGVWHPPTLS
ncbi:MAG: hypothetical protein IPL55_11000 [Saprospiraceae bacterium]|nr:hypothetical protein [Saprospiraceae bacterium]MBL0024603.1 hypothetical protein [Saprospiraceae bacterium]